MHSSFARSRAPRLLALVALPFLGAIAGCSADADEDAGDDETNLGVTQSAVQVQGLGYQFAVVQDGSRAAKATGAIEIPMLNPDGTRAYIVTTGGSGWTSFAKLSAVRGTCGVTFISPHYAITAAHCVASKFVRDPANETFVVRHYDVSTANLSSLYAAAQTKGTYPSYEPYGTAMGNVPGYQSTALSCKVVSRCAFQGDSAYNCEFGGDVAMLHCANRSSTAPWLHVASAEQPDGPVDMYWFHELLSIFPIDQPSTSDIEMFDRFTHYTQRGTTGSINEYKNNWHYIDTRTNALLPLKSVPFSNGATRRRFGINRTNLFGCHGTSGSGILQRNAAGEHELLGPASLGWWASNRLCAHPYDFGPNNSGVEYASLAVVKQLESKYSRALLLDRRPLVIGWSATSPATLSP